MTALASAAHLVLASRRPELASSPIATALIQAGSGLFVFGVLTWAIGRRLLGLDRVELGWAAPRVGLRGFGRGLALGSAIGAMAIGAGAVLGVASWQPDGGSFGSWVARVALLAVLLLPLALLEEVAFRGVAFAGLARAAGQGPAVLATALLFAATHRLNPNVTALGLGNVALAGILLGLTFLARGGLWTATGAHLGWNLALAGLAAPVSGLRFEVPWIDFSPGAPWWLTGGGFGPEGGLLATMALLIGIAVAARWTRVPEEA